MISHKVNKKINRREFINYLLAIISVPTIIWWMFVGGRNAKMREGEEQIFIGKELPTGVNLLGSAIIVNKDHQPKAFEAKCTHLGCAINKIEGDAMVCQCHGSRFDLNGKATKGPAKNSLRELTISKDNSGNFIINK